MNVLPLQGYMRTTLGASARLAALIGNRIYDRVVVDAPLPYIVIGPIEGDLSEASSDCIDDWEITSTVDIWSRAVGFPEAKEIGAAVYDALKNNHPVIAGINIGIFHMIRQVYSVEDDGLTLHGLLEYFARAYERKEIVL